MGRLQYIGLRFWLCQELYRPYKHFMNTALFSYFDKWNFCISKMMCNDLKCNLSAYSAFKNTVQGYELNFFAFQAISFGPVMFVLVILLTSSLKRTRILEQSTLSLDSTGKKNVQVRVSFTFVACSALRLCMYKIEFAVQTALNTL